MQLLAKKKLIFNFDIDLKIKFINEIRNFVWVFFFFFAVERNFNWSGLLFNKSIKINHKYLTIEML